MHTPEPPDAPHSSHRAAAATGPAPATSDAGADAAPLSAPANAAGTDLGELLSELDHATRVLGLRMQKVLTGLFKELNVSVPVAHALRELSEPLAMSVLADRLNCDASYVTMLADQMEERGFASREPDPDDRRVKRLVRTHKGDGVADSIQARLMRDHPIFANLSVHELADILTLLRKGLGIDAIGDHRAAELIDL